MTFAFDFIAWFWLGFGTWLASNAELENEEREEVEENVEKKERMEEWILL